jgi:hypothetical protein
MSTKINPRSRMVARQEMEAGLAQLVLLGEMPSDHAVHSHLTQYAGYDVGPKELVLLLSQAFERAQDESFFNLNKLIDVLTGESESGKKVATGTKEIIANISKTPA